MTEKEQLYRALLRAHLSAFIAKSFDIVSPRDIYQHGWHIDLMAQKLMDVYAGRIKRLIINVPPRHMKSISASIALPAFMLGHDPSKKIIVVSYGDDLALKLSLDTRRLMESQLYNELFPRLILSKHNNTQNQISTTMGGFRLAVSIGGAITGLGGDVIIIDDPIKPDDVTSDPKRQRVNDIFDSTLYSRLNDRVTGAIIVIMQRLHEDDLVGHLLQQEGWELLSLPAIAEEYQEFTLYNLKGEPYTVKRQPGDVLHPERFSIPELRDIQANIGTFRYAAQYQQSPAPLDGGFVKISWFGRYDRLPVGLPKRIVHSWDTASKIGITNAYSVGTVWHEYDNKFYLVDVIRERLEFPQLQLKIIEMAEVQRPNAVLIEDKSSGTALIQHLKHRTSIPVVAINPELDKAARMEGQSPLIHAGRVYIPDRAPWLNEFINEVAKFPNSKFADQVDSMSQGLKYLTEFRVEPRIRILEASPYYSNYL